VAHRRIIFAESVFLMNNGKKAAILLVEDEPIISIFERQLIEREGYSVLTASTGEEAIEVAEKNPGISLILMDIDLGPGIDGTVAAQRIIRTHEIPIVFLSSHIEPEIVEKTEGITSYGYVVKNSGETVLLTSIRMAFKLFQAHRDIAEQNKRMELANIQLLDINEKLVLRDLALHQSELRFRSIVEGAPEPIFIQTDYRFAYLNTAALSLFGATDESLLIGKPILERVHAEYHEKARERIRLQNVERQPVREVLEQKWSRLDGSEIWVETTGEPIEYEGKNGALVFVRDITERKKNTMLIEWRHRLLEYVIRHDPSAVAIFDKEMRFMFVSERFLEEFRIMGIDVIGKNHYEVFPDLPGIIREAHRRALQGEVVIFEGDIAGAAENIAGCNGWECRPWHEADGSIGGIIIYVEIFTDRKKIDQQLRILAHNAPDLIFRLELIPEIRFTYVSPSSARMIGYTPEDHYADPGLWKKVIHPDDFDFLQKSISNPDMLLTPVAIRWLRRDGTTIWTEQNIVPEFDETGARTAIEGISRDITDRIKAEREIQHCRALFEKMQQMAHIGYWQIELPSRHITVSDEVYRIFGYDERPEGDSNQIFFAAIHPEDRERVTSTYAESLNRNDAGYEIEHRITRAETGEIRYVKQKCTHERDEENRIARSSGMIQDVTESKRLQAELDDKFRKLKTLIDVTMVGSWEWNIQTGETVYNERWADIVGYTLEELSPVSIRTWEELTDTEGLQKSEELLARHLAGELPYYSHEYRMKHKLGREVWVHDQGKIVSFDSEGKPLMMYGTHTDITERKLLELQVERQLQEKSALLKETHHRMKNNLAVLQGLLSAEVRSVTNPETVAVLHDAQTSITGMRLIYEKLLISDTYTNLSSRDYFLDLIDAVISLFARTQDISVDKQIDDFQISTKLLFPLGIIANELLTNTMKYAFTDNRPGRVIITLSRTGSMATLAVRDNGVGFSTGPGGDSHHGFGLTLVKMLCDQIGAKFFITNDQGTSAHIDFELTG